MSKTKRSKKDNKRGESWGLGRLGAMVVTRETPHVPRGFQFAMKKGNEYWALSSVGSVVFN